MIFISYGYKAKEENKLNKTSGIYCIINKINGKRYIGQTYDLKYRKMRHICDLRGNRHSNNHLQASWNKYGEDAFEYVVVEECSLDIINEREIYWICYYDVLKTGYNQAQGGMGCRGYKHTEEELAKMRQIQNPKPVLQLDSKGNFIRRWVSASHAAKTLGVWKLGIKNCCEQSRSVMSCGGYIWIYEEDKDTVDMQYYFKKKSNAKKKINQYDLNMNLIKTWKSMMDAVKYGGFNMSVISRVCNGKGKTHKGFIFKFAEEYDD